MIATAVLLAQFVAPPAFSAGAPGAVTSQAATQTADSGVVTGVVRDAGGVIPNAVVVVRSASGGERQTLTGTDGRFSIAAPAGQIIVIVQARGFGEKRQTLAPGANRQNLEIVVAPSTVSESVTVTASKSEQRLGDVPASVSV